MISDLRKLLSVSLVSLSSCLTVESAQLTFSWDARPPQEAVTLYRLYSVNNAGVPSLLSSSTSNSVSVVLADGVYRVGVTAANDVGEGGLSTLLNIVITGTNVVTVTKTPGAPVNISVK